MDTNTVSENILTAIDIIAQSVVDGISYDETITCTIIDDSARESGKYIVTDGSTQFPAYSETTTYRNNTLVYVTVPQGDYTQQKIITGKKVNDSSEPFAYTKPFDTFLPCTPNILDGEISNKEYSLLANKDEETKGREGLRIWNKSNVSRYYKNFDRLGIKANFKSLLSASKIASGNYGIQMKIDHLEKNIQTDNEKENNNETTHIISSASGWRADREYYIEDNDPEKGEVSYKCVEVVEYKPNVYYYKENNKGIIDTNITITLNRDYYKNQNCEDADKVNIYTPNKYYYKNYVLDTWEFPTEDREYYHFIGNDNNLKYEKVFPETEYSFNNSKQEKNYKGLVTKDNSISIYIYNSTEEKYEENPYKTITIKEIEKDFGEIIQLDEKWELLISDIKKEAEDSYQVSLKIKEKNFYKPDVYYYIPDGEEYILSVDNGFNSELQYYTYMDSVAMVTQENFLNFKENEIYYYNEDGNKIDPFKEKENGFIEGTNYFKLDYKSANDLTKENYIAGQYYIEKYILATEFTEGKKYHFINNEGKFKIIDNPTKEGYEQGGKLKEGTEDQYYPAYYIKDKVISSDNGFDNSKEYYVDKFVQVEASSTSVAGEENEHIKVENLYYKNDKKKWQLVGKDNVKNEFLLEHVCYRRDFQKILLTAETYEPNKYYEKTNDINATMASNGVFYSKVEENGFVKGAAYFKLDYEPASNLTKENYVPNTYYIKQYIPATEFVEGKSYFDSKGNDIRTATKEGYEQGGKLKENTEDQYYPVYCVEKYVLSTANGYDKTKVYFHTNKKTYQEIPMSYNKYYPNIYYIKNSDTYKTVSSYLILDVKDMIGMPYAFDNYYSQEKVFDISNFGDIQNIELSFFQDNNFVTIEKKRLTYGENNVVINDNLFVNNIEIYFGYDISEMEDDYLKLFTYEALNYRASKDANENIKKIYLKWAHKEGDKTYILDENNIDFFQREKVEELENFFISLEQKPSDYDNLKNINYSFKIDTSSTAVEDRVYFDREIKSYKQKDDEGNPSDYWNYYNINFIKNQSEDYLDSREYYQLDYYQNSEVYEYDDENNIINIKDEFIELKENNIVKKYKSELNPVSSGTVAETETTYAILKTIYAPNENSEAYQYKDVFVPFTPEEGFTFDDSNKYYKLVYAELEDENSKNYYIQAYKKIANPQNLTKSELYTCSYADYKQVTSAEEAAAADYKITYTQTNLSYEPGKFYYLSVTDNLFEIRWYRYSQGAASADKYSGVYWERIPNEGEGTHLINDFICELHPDSVYNATEQVKAIIIFNEAQEDSTSLFNVDSENIFYSNILEFTNDDPVVDIPNIQQEHALRFSIIDGTFGNYYVYDEANSLIDSSQSKIERKIKLLFDLEDFQSSALLKDATKVTWVFPVENTMINVNTYNGEYYSSNGYGYLVDRVSREEYSLTYTIESYYAHTKNNNTITCHVEKDGINYSATYELSFGQAGSNGTEYTLTLDLMSSDQVVTLNPLESKDIYALTYRPADNIVQDGTIYYELVVDAIGEKNLFIEYNLDNYDGRELYIESIESIEASDAVQHNFDKYYRKDENGEYVEINAAEATQMPWVQATFFDQAHRKVDISEYEIEWNWLYDQSLFEIIRKDNNSIELKDIGSDNKKNEICILKATLKGWGDYDLTSYLPIPLRDNYAPVRFQGPTQIIYSSMGTPNYYKDDICLYYNDSLGGSQSYPISDKTLKIYTNDTNIDIIEYSFNSKSLLSSISAPSVDNEGKKYFIIYKFVNGKRENEEDEGDKIEYKDSEIVNIEGNVYIKIIKEKDKIINCIIRQNNTISGNNYYPLLKFDTDSNTGEPFCRLMPSSTYVDGLKGFGIQCFDLKGNWLWTQPILNIQNRYFSSTINQWDGNLKVDEDENTILAKMIGAGRKNSDNTFSGVILGDWTDNVNVDNGTTGSSMSTMTGLYGFHEGGTSFGFMEDGTGFIGKAGHGRILFDGNNSTITSSAWTDSKHGMFLDVDDGFILLRDSTNNGNYLKLNALATGEKFANDSISTFATPSSIPLAGKDKDTDYPFMIKGPNAFTGIGWSGNLLLQSKDGDNKRGISINSSANTYPINVNNYFGVAWDGATIISSKRIDDYKYPQLINEEIDYIDDDSIEDIVTYIDQRKYDSDSNWDDNKYDYSYMDSNFHGLYLSPLGDIYASRKIVVGDSFTVNEKGYLRADSALFNNTNADVFKIYYTFIDDDDTIQDKRIYLEQNFIEMNLNENKNDREIPMIGEMGWLRGAYEVESEDGTRHRELQETLNLGIRSSKGFGIKLDSGSNISIESKNYQKEFGELIFEKKIDSSEIISYAGSPSYGNISIDASNNLNMLGTLGIHIESSLGNIDSVSSKSNVLKGAEQVLIESILDSEKYLSQLHMLKLEDANGNKMSWGDWTVKSMVSDKEATLRLSETETFLLYNQSNTTDKNKKLTLNSNGIDIYSGKGIINIATTVETSGSANAITLHSAGQTTATTNSIVQIGKNILNQSNGQIALISEKNSGTNNDEGILLNAAGSKVKVNALKGISLLIEDGNSGYLGLSKEQINLIGIGNCDMSIGILQSGNFKFLNGGRQLWLNNVQPSDQHGIYARFA